MVPLTGSVCLKGSSLGSLRFRGLAFGDLGLLGYGSTKARREMAIPLSVLRTSSAMLAALVLIYGRW